VSIDKPPRGEPCNGCGLCCRLELCEIGAMAFGDDQPAPCPALRLDADTGMSRCSFVECEIAYELEPMLQKALGIGGGCLVDDDVIGAS